MGVGNPFVRRGDRLFPAHRLPPASRLVDSGPPNQESQRRGIGPRNTAPADLRPSGILFNLEPGRLGRGHLKRSRPYRLLRREQHREPDAP